MMNERMQTKYMTVLEDMYVRKSFTLVEMREKHRVQQNFFIVVKRLGYIKKVDGKRRYIWNSGTPTKRHLNRVKNAMVTLHVTREVKQQQPSKRVVKILWGLITYEL
jgi:hypothetical protein